MPWPTVIGFAVVLASVLAAEFLRVRAGLQLTDQQRNQVVTVGAYRRAVRTILVMGLCLWFVPLALVGLPIVSIIRWCMLVIAAPLAVWLHISYFQKLRALGLPASYIRSHERARYVVYAGCALGVVVAYAGSKVP